MGKHIPFDSEPTKETILRLREQGYSWDSVAAMYEVSAPTIRSRAMRFGVADVAPRPTGPRPTPHDTNEIDTARLGLPKASTGLTKESELRVFLAALLRRDGWLVGCEVRISDGRLDIYATKDIASVIVEVKTGDLKACAQAIGQVLLYAGSYPHATPVIAIPAQIAQNPSLITACDRAGVEIWPIH